MNVVKHNEIKDQIAAGEARMRAREESTLLDRAGERAIEAKDGFTRFAKDHPVAVIAGGLALGVLVSGLFRNSPTRKAGRVAAEKTGTAATIGSQLAASWFAQAMAAAGEARRAGADHAADVADGISVVSRKARREAGHLTHEAGASAREFKRDALRLIDRAMSNRKH
ncbi:hypothetical protein [Croceibacterium ferulae]|uniref:hypothetical protein n=1 Tax=Croceibacterium ferulae TaxID=1854641 RepID=UPI000EB49765|nr:hypothetical protein [Croceibacterium ferulae]